MFQHELFQPLDFTRHVLFAHLVDAGAVCAIGGQAVGFLARLLAIDAVDQVLDALVDAARLNAHGEVVGHLLGAASIRLVDRLPH
ncbi:hypothetical protein D9M69_713030 [compost metagenome]